MWPWLLAAPWAVFAGWWLVRAFSTARTESRESSRQLMTHRVLICAATLFMLYPPQGLRGQVWHPTPLLLGIALAVEIVGLGFAIWAREHLGPLWSGVITLKEGHHIVQTGPYRLARHPIYTGLLTALVGAVISRGNWAAFVAFALFAIGLARKIVTEEQMLSERFGDEYAAYRKKVRAIIPFVL